MVRLNRIPGPSGHLHSSTLPNQHEKKNPLPVIVGVLTTANKKGLPGGEKSRLFKEMVDYGKKQNIFIYFFFARDVEWRKRRIGGFVWTGRQWRRGLFPFPDIIYNRIRFRNIESQARLSNCCGNLNETHQFICLILAS